MPEILPHVFPHRFVNHSSNFPYSAVYFIGLSKQTSTPASSTSAESKQPDAKKKQADFASAIHIFERAMDSWPKRSPSMDLVIKHIKRW